MEDQWGPHPLRFSLPYNLALSTTMYMDHAYPQLNLEQTHNNLFLRPGLGTPMFDAQHLAAVWEAMQAQHSAPWTAFSPKAFRDIHINDKVMHLSQAVAATGVPVAGDAAIMQNSGGKVWERAYQKHGAYFNNMVEGAIDKMAAWRQAALDKLVKPQPLEATSAEAWEEEQEEAMEEWPAADDDCCWGAAGDAEASQDEEQAEEEEEEIIEYYDSDGEW